MASTATPESPRRWYQRRISLFASLERFAHRRFIRWVDTHIPRASQHLLNRKKLFIFPSRRGLALMGVILILWLLGTNYQNNLILALAFLLTSVFVVVILETHNNLTSLRISYAGASPAFAGENVEFVFSLESQTRKYCESLEFKWDSEDDSLVNVIVAPGESIKIRVALASDRRGWLKPGRLLVQSYFPLGIMRCWSWLNWDMQALVYPRPLPCSLPGAASTDEDSDGHHPSSGGEDFSGLRDYRSGDSLKQIAWKSFAQEKGLFVKEFGQNVSRETWLDFSQVPFADPEERLSGLCYWALEFSQRDEFFGVLLPGQVIEPDKGENHRRRVLEALAMFGSH